MTDGQAPVLAAPQQQLVHQRLCVTWRCVSSAPQHLQISQSAYLYGPPSCNHVYTAIPLFNAQQHCRVIVSFVH